MKASSCRWVTAFLGVEKGRAVYAEPGNGQGTSINCPKSVKFIILLISFFYSFNLMLLHQSHELVQHWKGELSALKEMQCNV